MRLIESALLPLPSQPGVDFTDRLDQLEPNRRMVGSWLLSSGLRMRLVFAMKNHMALLALVRLVSNQKYIKGISTSEEEALRRIVANQAGLLICSDQLAEGSGFSLCRRAVQAVADLKVIMVLTGEGTDGALALESGATAVVCEEDFMGPEMEVMQSLLAAANDKTFLSKRAKARMKKTTQVPISPQSLTPREQEILVMLLQGASDLEIARHLQISIHTVKEYGKSIRAKYKVKTRLQLLSSLLGSSLSQPVGP